MFDNMNVHNYFFQKILDLHTDTLDLLKYIYNKQKYCEKVLEKNSLSLIYNILRYYEVGKTQLVEEKSIIQEGIGNSKIYELSVDQHSNEYGFFNSDSVIENFLTNI